MEQAEEKQIPGSNSFRPLYVSLCPSSFTPVEFWQLEDQNPPAKKCHESSVFTLKEMEEATNSFSDENFIGKGGFGKVYKGTLRSGEVWFGKHTFKLGELTVSE